MDKTVLISISKTELEALIIDCIKVSIPEASSEALVKKHFNLDGLRDYLPQNYSKATLYVLLSKGQIPGHKHGKKWYFLKSEIDDWLTKGKVKSTEEIKVEVDNILSKR